MAVVINGTTGIDKVQDGSIGTADIAADAITTPKIASSVNLGRRNLIINGSQQVSQRGTTFTTPASDGQLTDRWSVLANTNGASKITYSQVTDSPNEFTYSIKADVATALTPLGASDYHILRYNGFEQQDINQLAMGSSDAKEITLSFWVKSNKTGTLAAEFQMNSVEASGASVELAKTYTINAANTWEKKTLTYPANTGHTSNQSGVSRGMLLYMWVASGSNYQSGSIDTTWGVNNNRTTGIDNYLDSTSNEIYWTGFQLEVGDTATPFEHRSYGEELAACQRYFESQHYPSNDQLCVSNRWSGYAYMGHITCMKVKRTEPTVSSTGVVKHMGQAAFSGNITPNWQYMTPQGIGIYSTATSGPTGDAVLILSEGITINIDAEL